ncbi:MAG: hydroxymethylglutaryl-CoA lyase [Phycisphaerales bacterium]|nr:hydroxymethylglutaryl-CoA lyase [Phycisphaerales bacterium]
MSDDARVVHLTEVGPRDGLQNEQVIVPLATKIQFVEMLAASGLRSIEVTSFVSPKWVPQLADAEELLRAIKRETGVCYSALVPNEKGLERALAVGVDAIAIFTAASESFAKKNINASIAESVARFLPVVRDAKAAGIRVRGYVSCVIACPFDGKVEPSAVRDVTRMLLDLGVDEIDLGDTIGVAVPADIARLYAGLADTLTPSESVLHLHDTSGTAMACAARALELGVRKFDGSVGGLGGCPYAPGASGNAATEELVAVAQQCGYSTGVSLARLCDAGRFVAAALGRSLPSRMLAAESCQRADGTSATL